MNPYAARYGKVLAFSSRSIGPRPMEMVRPAGQATYAGTTFSPAGTRYYSYATDASGNSVSVDVSGNPISGTVNGPAPGYATLPDSSWGGGSIAQSGESGTSGTTPAPAITPAEITAAATLLGQSAGDVTQIILGADANARDQLATTTQVQIDQLNHQADADLAAGNNAAAAAARASAMTLQQFQAQAGLQQSSNLMTTVLIGVLGLGAIAGLITWAVVSSGPSARRSSARRNPSRGHRRRRRHRRHAA